MFIPHVGTCAGHGSVGSDVLEENLVVPSLSTDEKEDEYLSETEEESDIRSSIGQISLPNNSSEFDMLQDDEETIIVTDELQKGCGCSEMCYQQFNMSEVRDFWLSIKELDKHERDLFLMGKLHVLITDLNIVTHAHSSKSAKKRRIRAVYAFDHRIVCQHAFCFLHNIGDFTLCALRKHITEAGPYPREHGSKGRKAYNAYPYVNQVLTPTTSMSIIYHS